MKTFLIFVLVSFGWIHLSSQGNSSPPSVNSVESNLSLQDQVYALDQVYKQFSLVVRSVSTSLNEHQEDMILLDVRKIEQHREALGEKETADLKQAIYKAIGRSFPLEITSYVIPNEAEAVGIITEIDAEDHKVLIVNPEWCLDRDCKEHESYWVKPENDIKIISEVQDGMLNFGQLRIGDWIEVWSNGAVLQSAPAEMLALDIVVKIEKNEPAVALSSLLKTNFEPIKQIDIRYGDGKSLTLTDEKVLERIASMLKKIELTPARDQRTVIGFLYFMDITIGDRKIRYENDLRFGDLKYLHNFLTQELNDEIVRIGREKIPNLLPGIVRQHNDDRDKPFAVRTGYTA
ncbi:hypothetical protein ACFQZT_22780 [Paenibacillus sp. GCM10027628]|uniref:hypothetical protein n=1 Tax=Paenibacillus sp. GCM10027628 TaxID=3273413 RepID=UPI0036399567